MAAACAAATFWPAERLPNVVTETVTIETLPLTLQGRQAYHNVKFREAYGTFQGFDRNTASVAGALARVFRDCRSARCRHFDGHISISGRDAHLPRRKS